MNKKTSKVINLKTDDSEKDVYRIITRGYGESLVSLNINSYYEYFLNKSNNFRNVWEISKGEFSFKAVADEHNLLFTKILEGSIYDNFILPNNMIKKANSNNIIFQIYTHENISSFNIEITNSEKTKFYYKLYKIQIIIFFHLIEIQNL